MFTTDEKVRYTHWVTRRHVDGSALLREGMVGTVLRAERRRHLGYLVLFETGTQWVREDRLELA
jgi:hypothetical protein